MYIMYSLVCCGARKRIHNIDNCGLWFVCLVCCGTRKRIHNIDNCGIWFVCLVCCVAHVSLYIKHWYGSGSLWRTVCVILNSLYVGAIHVRMNCLYRPMCNNRFRSGLCFGLICGTILMMNLIVLVV